MKDRQKAIPLPEQQLLEANARIAELEAQVRLLTIKNQSETNHHALEAQLEKAERVIGYYAEENTWISKNLDKEGSLVSWSKKTPNDNSIFPYSIGSSNGNFNCLGRRARECFSEKKKSG